MPELDAAQRWRLTLDTPELRVVLKALSAQLFTEEERAEAQELCDRISYLRGSVMKTIAKDGDRIVEKTLAKVQVDRV